MEMSLRLCLVSLLFSWSVACPGTDASRRALGDAARPRLFTKKLDNPHDLPELIHRKLDQVINAPNCAKTNGGPATQTAANTCAAYNYINPLFQSGLDSFAGNVYDLSTIYGSLVRVAFHDAGEVDITQSDILGPDGCLSTDSANAGLVETGSIIDEVDDLWQDVCDQISRADFWVMLAKMAIEYAEPTGTINIPYQFGRIDATLANGCALPSGSSSTSSGGSSSTTTTTTSNNNGGGSSTSTSSSSSSSTVNGVTTCTTKTVTTVCSGSTCTTTTTVTNCDGSSTTTSSGGSNSRLPSAEDTVDDIYQVFVTQMGMTLNDASTLIGAHTVGHMHPSVSQYGRSGDASGGYLNGWDSTPHLFDNNFYYELGVNNWNGASCPTSSSNTCFTNTGNSNTVMLPSDISIAYIRTSYSSPTVQVCGPYAVGSSNPKSYGCTPSSTIMPLTCWQSCNHGNSNAYFLSQFELSFPKMTCAGYGVPANTPGASASGKLGTLYYLDLSTC